MTDMDKDDRDQLPEEDREYLDEKGYDYEVRRDGMLNVVIRSFQLPAAYHPRKCELLIRLPDGYADASPDMYWTTPWVRLGSETGSLPQAAEQPETYLGRPWQRWSRHFTGWRAGIDGLATYLASVRRDLDRGR
jgi:hypothetical protein